MMRETKDSGLEWIGEIPAEWGVSKIGQVYRLRNTKVSDTDYPPLSVTNKGLFHNWIPPLKQMHMMIANSSGRVTLLLTVVPIDVDHVAFLTMMVRYR